MASNKNKTAIIIIVAVLLGFMGVTALVGIKLLRRSTADPSPPPRSSTPMVTTIPRGASTMDLLVIDQTTKAPIAGLDIITTGIQPRFKGVSGPDGHVEVPKPADNNYNFFSLAVRGKGYVYKRFLWLPNSTSMGGDIPAEQTMKMEPATTIRGQVVEEGGKPIPRASVLLVFEKDYGDPHERIDISGAAGFSIVKTDSGGKFAFNGAPADCQSIIVGVSDARHLPFPAQAFDPMANLYDGTATITLAPGVTVAGVVVDQNGAPVDKANVSVRGATEAGHLPPTQITMPDGKFAFAFNPGDALTLIVNAKGFASERQEFVMGDKEQQLTIKLSPGR